MDIAMILQMIGTGERSEGYDVGRAKRNLQHALKWNDKADPEALKTAISALEEAERLCEGN